MWTGRERSRWLKRELGPGTNHGICEGDGWPGEGETESRRCSEAADGEGEGEGHGDCGPWGTGMEEGMLARALIAAAPAHCGCVSSGRQAAAAACGTEFG